MTEQRKPDRRPPTADCRSQVVSAARSWLGTPYHHAADVKGAGVDCAMILVRVFCDLGFVKPFDPRPYTKDWFMHRDEERYLGHLLAHAHEVTEPLPGDVMLVKVGRCFAHGGIVVTREPLTIVHAFAPARQVVEDEVRRMPDLAEKPHRFFSFWGRDGGRQSAIGSRKDHSDEIVSPSNEAAEIIVPDARLSTADCR